MPAHKARRGLIQRALSFRFELVIYWDDNNRFKPTTTVTTLATRGAAIYIGGRRSVIKAVGERGGAAGAQATHRRDAG